MQNTSGDKTREVQLSVREALSSKKEEPNKDSEAEFSNFLDQSDDDEASFDARMRQQILRRRKDLGDVPPRQKMHSVVFSSNKFKFYRCSTLDAGLYDHPSEISNCSFSCCYHCFLPRVLFS